MRFWEHPGCGARLVKPYACRLCGERTDQSLDGMETDLICPWCAQDVGRRICEGLGIKPGLNFFLSVKEWEDYREFKSRGERIQISKTLREKIFDRDGRTCQACGSTHKPTIDHKHPIDLGGGHGEDNLWTLCHRCNSSKGKKPLDKWLEERPQ